MGMEEEKMELNNKLTEALKNNDEKGVDAAAEALSQLENKYKEATTTSPAQMSQMDNLKADPAKVKELTQDLDAQAEQVRKELIEETEKLKNEETVEGGKKTEEIPLGAEKRKEEIKNEIKLIKMLVDYKEETDKLQKEFWEKFNANKSEVDISSHDSEEVQAAKKAKYQEMTKPFDEKRDKLINAFKENGFNDPKTEQDRLMGTSVWGGTLDNFAEARIKSLEEEQAKL